ncbi:MAG: GvpL/GvpF family gas vesicle protein, partial [Longimicrobiales bacterium]
MSEVEDRDADRSKPRLAAQQAIYFYGVARAKTWRGGLVGQVQGDDVLRLRYRDLEAIVRAVPYELPPMDDARLQAHQKVVEAAMRRGTVLPAPYGIIFRGRRQLIRLLQDQYLVLDEGLAFLEGHWEMRLHIAPSAPGDELALELSDLAMQLY